MRVVLPVEMSEIDRAAVEDENIPGLELMERAGASIFEAAVEMLARSGGRRVVVWCGKGNNGGDGLVVARLLARAGYHTRLFLLCPPDGLSGDAAVNLERLRGTGVEVEPVTSPDQAKGLDETLEAFDLHVDALFGTGFTGAAEGAFAEAIELINRSSAPVLSVDIPSGVDGATGAVRGPAVKATRTVTFAAPKVGLVQYPGRAFTGGFEVADIGIPEHLIESVPGTGIFLITEEEAFGLLPVRPPDAHKRSCGSVLVVGGSPGMTGAAAMCAQASLRAGAGLVTVAVPEGLHDIMEVKLTEVMTRPLAQNERGSLSTGALKAVLDMSRDFDVVAIGPGLSTAGDTPELVRELVGSLERAVVLDADGLNAMVGFTDIFEDRKGEIVLTPHPGEMARLTGSSTSEIQSDRIGAAAGWSKRWGAVVVLKGAASVVAEPGGGVRINTTGNPGMASAGMGDVLTGCIAALLAQGLEAFDAAAAGAYFHGYAADLAARMDGMVGMIAGDVIRNLPLAMRRPERETGR